MIPWSSKFGKKKEHCISLVKSHRAHWHIKGSERSTQGELSILQTYLPENPLIFFRTGAEGTHFGKYCTI